MNGVILVEDIDENLQEWHRLRADKITGTMIATIAGVGFESPLQLWAKKTRKINDVFEDNPLFEFGTFVEPFIISRASKKLQRPVYAFKAFVQHPQIEWAAASLDALVEGPTELLDCKSTRHFMRDQWSENTAPVKYEMQMQWGMGCTGLLGAYLACLIGGDPTDIPTPHFDFDQAYFGDLLVLADRFRQCVERDIPPDPGPGDSRLIEEIVQRRYGETKIPDPDEEDWVSTTLATIAYLTAEKEQEGAKIKKLEDEISTAKNKIKLWLGHYDAAALSDGRIVAVKQIDVEPRFQNGYSYTKLRTIIPSKKRGRA